MPHSPIHIVNGDSALHLLREAGLKDDIIVWREMLCDGPCTGHPGEDSFWKLRADYFESIGISASDYEKMSRSEIEKIAAIPAEAEIHLWFELDLFCFVNYCSLLDYLRALGKTEQIFLHCPEGRSALGGFLTLADFSPKDILDIDPRVLDSKDVKEASLWWKAYTAGDDAALYKASQAGGGFMQLAYTAHRERMPLSGLSMIETEIITYLADGPQSLQDLIRHLLIWQKDQHYGFGDLQYQDRIERLNGTYLNIEEKMVSLSGEIGELEAMQFGGFKSA